MSKRLSRLAAAGVLVASFCFGAVASSEARRKPTERERTAILRAVTEPARCGANPPESCRLVVRVSTVRLGWAAVYLRPRPGFEDWVQQDVASVRRRRGRWRLHERGNGGGCRVPADVRRDLRLACY